MKKQFVDITKIDIQFEHLKLKNLKTEKELLGSIAEKDINDHLLGIWSNDNFILVDGFKRYRCALKLHITQLPCQELAQEKAEALIKTLKISNSKSLHILEQAKFIKQLKDKHQMTATDVAVSLGKSVYWVTTRLTLLKELTPLLEEKIFKGQFPVWNAMGILHQSKRSKIATDDEINNFVKAVSNRGLGVKDIDLLANGYFRGGQEIKNQINNGNLIWSINRLKDFSNVDSNLKNDEKTALKDLEIIQKYVGRIIFKLPRLNKKSNDFLSMAEILAEGILDKQDNLKNVLSNFIRESKK